MITRERGGLPPCLFSDRLLGSSLQSPGQIIVAKIAVENCWDVEYNIEK